MLDEKAKSLKTLRKNDQIPEAYRGREQTFIKHKILDHYLERAARNILWSQNEFVFVDGFSGPWGSRTSGYTDTSFGIAIRKLRHVRDEFRTKHNRPRQVRCIFIEKHRSAFENLTRAIKDVSYLECFAINGRFEDHVEEVLQRIGNGFALVSVDPKGWNFDLRKMGPILRHRPSEVIVTFMFEFINRFLDDKRSTIHRSYGLPFGDANWRSQFEKLLAQGMEREEAAVELFREQLKKVGEYKYVLSTRIQRPTADRSLFYLFYGTRHEKGLVEFRKVEKEAMLAEEAARIEARHAIRTARSGIDTLFSAIELSPPRAEGELRRPELERAIDGITRTIILRNSLYYEDAMPLALEKYSITESEFKDILVQLKVLGRILFEGMKSRQRKPDRGVKLVSCIPTD